MNRDNILETVRNNGNQCSEVMEPFIIYYMDRIEYLHQVCLDCGCSDEESFLVARMEYWMDREGLPIFLDAISKVPDSDAGRVKGFIKLYTFLLKESGNDARKLADHLIYLPGAFINEMCDRNTEMPLTRGNPVR